MRVACLVVTEEDAARVEDARARLATVAGAGQLELTVFAPRVRPVLARKLRSLLRPFSETLHADGLATALGRHADGGYDALHLDQLWSGWVGLGRPRALLNVYQFEVVDWEGRRLRTLAEGKALLQMRRATRRILKGSRHVRVVTRRLLERARADQRRGRLHADPLCAGPLALSGAAARARARGGPARLHALVAQRARPPSG